MKTLTEYLIEGIKQHVDLQFYCNPFYVCNEKYEVIDDVYKNIDNIYKSIEDKQDYIIIELNDFKEFKIIFDIKELNDKRLVFGYNYENTIVENNNAKINIDCNINYNLIDENSESYDFDYTNALRDLILHELTHAYEDCERIKNCKNTFNDLYTNEYAIASVGITQGNRYSVLVSRFSYFLNPVEQLAYLSKLTNDIKKIIKDNNWNTRTFDNKKFFEELLKLDTWNQYFELGKIIVQLNNGIVPDYSKELIIKELTIKWNKFKNKFEQLVPKILFDNLEQPKIFI